MFQGSAIINDSNLLSETSGSASNGGNTRSFGILNDGVGLITILDTTLSTVSSGNADGIGSLSGTQGIRLLQGSAVITNTLITAESRGEESNNGSKAAFAVLADMAGQSVTLNNAVIRSTSEGAAVSAIGVRADTVNFEGDMASFISAIPGMGGIGIAVDAPNINNNSLPLSQCSVDGVNFTDC